MNVVTKLPVKKDRIQTITLTPELANAMLELNGLNRPLSEQHVQRIARQIISGKWRFNGDTIKLSDTGDVLDGQHRLWAIIEARQPVETIIVYGIARDAFATIDTLRKPRGGPDVLALSGCHHYRPAISGALQWLIRWQRGSKILLDYRNPKNRVENADLEEIFASHGGINLAAERAMKLRRIANSSLLTFLYYIMVNRNGDIAERMMRTLEYPAGVGQDDPFFCLRHYFTTSEKAKQPLMTIALTIKAANAAFLGKSIKVLKWQNQGERPEDFPTLKIDAKPEGQRA